MTDNLPVETISQMGAVTSINYDIPTGWEQWYLNVSDCHFDSVYCNREIMAEQFDEALKRNARINCYGDWFDAMQGKFDYRRSMEELRPEYRRSDYYDYVIKDSAEWLAPYSANIDVMSDGNHEIAVLKNANTNMMDRLVGMLRQDNKDCQAIHGGYGGWIRYMFDINTVLTSVRAKYYHGASTSTDAPVTRGVIQTNRQAVFLPDANIVFNGHNHNAYYVPITRERLSNKGISYFDIQHHVRIPGYKQNYGDGTTGWDVMRGGPPKPIGGVWTRLYYIDNGGRQKIEIQVFLDMRNPEPVSVDPDRLFDNSIDPTKVIYAED